MKYYILSETREVAKKKNTYVYIWGIVILCVLANLSMLAFRTIYGVHEGSYASNLIIFAVDLFCIPYYSTILIADIAFGKEYPNPYIKTKTTIGLSRTKLYVGKLISALLVGAGFMLVAIPALIGITFLFMAADGSVDGLIIWDFCQKVLVAIPLWIAGISMGTMFLYVFPKKRKAYTLFFLSIIVIPRIIIFLVEKLPNPGIFKLIKDYVLLTPRFNDLRYFYTLNIPQIIITSLVYIGISTTIGIIVYRKKEFS